MGRGDRRGAPAREPGRPAGRLLHGVHPVIEALRAGRRPLVRVLVRRGARRGDRARLAAAAKAAGVGLEELAPEAFDALAPPGVPTQGVLLRAGPLPEVSLDELAAGAARPRTLVALDGVEDPQNLGAIIRCAEASGAAGLLLTRRRAPPLGPAVARASSGAVEWLPVARVANLRQALERLKQRGFWIYGCDPTGETGLFELPDRWLGDARVVVLGAEGRGLRPGVREALDYRLGIPMAGRVGSLNVAAAAAVVLFELRRRGGGPPQLPR